VGGTRQRLSSQRGKIAAFRLQDLPCSSIPSAPSSPAASPASAWPSRSTFVAHGGKVALFDVNDDKGAAAVAELGEANARYFKTDVSNEAGVTANVDAAREFLGGLNAAINCAGILGAGRVLGKEGPMPLSQFQTTVMVNLVGSFNVAKAAAAIMQNNEAVKTASVA
jgi:NAD(P)-dependent dehydrogenase (short-subunit alcohol dehydrogenase family)